jgi:hypothetical protein
VRTSSQLPPFTCGLACVQVAAQVASVWVTGPELQVVKRYWQYFWHCVCVAEVQPPIRSSA